MLDPFEQAMWFCDYLSAALKFPETRGDRRKASEWAHSMSLIAEQFYDNDDRELVETDA